MGNQMVFKRYEIKYLMNRRQRDAIVQAMEPYMSIDAYGHSSISNIYYDTPNFRLIRTSLEKPVYKEKLRVRSYGRAAACDPVFVELKKKYKDVVYKRRCFPSFWAASPCFIPLCTSGKADGTRPFTSRFPKIWTIPAFSTRC